MAALNPLLADNRRLLGKLAVIAVLMFGFGYALVPMYRTICEALGINVLTLSDQRTATGSWTGAVSASVSATRTDTWLSTSESGRPRAPQMEPSSSEDASFSPRSTSLR